MTNSKGAIPIEFDDWTRYHEMGPKTVALLLWTFLGKETTIPVNSHVFLFMRSLMLTNAKTEEECSWQMQKYAQKGSFISIINSIGSTGQTMSTPNGRMAVILVTKQIASTALQQLMFTLIDKYAQKGNMR